MKDGIEIEIKRARWEILKMMYNMKSPEVSRFVPLASMGREFKSVFEKVGRKERRDQFSKVHAAYFSKFQASFLKHAQLPGCGEGRMRSRFPCPTSPMISMHPYVAWSPFGWRRPLWGKPMGW